MVYKNNLPSKFRSRIWVEINDESKGKHDNSNIRLKMSIIRSNLCYYSGAYIILVKGTITVPNMRAAGAAVNNNKKVLFKYCAPFTDCITEINNTQVDDPLTIGIVMPMYNIVMLVWRYQEVYGNTI